MKVAVCKSRLYLDQVCHKFDKLVYVDEVSSYKLFTLIWESSESDPRNLELILTIKHQKIAKDVFYYLSYESKICGILGGY